MIRVKCAFCGRLTVPAVFIGNMAVGPTCAHKAGMTKGKFPKASAVRFVTRKPKRGAPEPETMDMFDDM